MNAVLRWIDYWNRQVKKFTILDLKLAQLWAIGFVLIVVKIFPEIMELSVLWFVATMAICAPRLGYVLWVKEEEHSHGANPNGTLSP
jgi:hypothetical protein